MRKPVTILLTLLLSLMIVGLAAAVPYGSLREADIARHKDAYQPEEFSFLNTLGEDGDAGEDAGPDFGDDEDDGLDFGDDEDDGIDFGDE